MSDNNSLFDHIGTEINDKSRYLDFMDGVSNYVNAIEVQYNSDAVGFEARGLAHQICASQEMNTILYDIALSLRVIAGRDK